ncbi:MAG: hypothetical protein ACI9T7_003200 [Oleiphilaceae bacterium]|jgi:hypothetical protein
MDCLLGQISHNSVILGLNSGVTLWHLPESKSADMSRHDLTAKSLAEYMIATADAAEKFTLNEMMMIA